MYLELRSIHRYIKTENKMLMSRSADAINMLIAWHYIYIYSAMYTYLFLFCIL